jgi:hypothetical protein
MLLNDQFTLHVRVVSACVVVRSFLPCDVTPGRSGVDATGIERRRFAIRSSDVGHDAVVLPFHGLARVNGHGCRLKSEPANHNRDRRW